VDTISAQNQALVVVGFMDFLFCLLDFQTQAQSLARFWICILYILKSRISALWPGTQAFLFSTLV